MENAIATVSANLSSAEREHLISRARDERSTLSEYVRRLIREDIRRAETEALTALSLDDLARSQDELCRQLTLLHRDFPNAMQSMNEQLDLICTQQAESARRELQLHQRLLEGYTGTSDLVVAALDQCQIIFDANNSLFEAIERRTRTGGR